MTAITIVIMIATATAIVMTAIATVISKTVTLKISLSKTNVISMIL